MYRIIVFWSIAACTFVLSCRQSKFENVQVISQTIDSIGLDTIVATEIEQIKDTSISKQSIDSEQIKKENNLNQTVDKVQKTKENSIPKAASKQATSTKAENPSPQPSPTNTQPTKEDLKPNPKPEKVILPEKAPNHLPSEPKTSSHIDHTTFDSELRKYVDINGKVNYASWAKNRSKLDAYISEMANHIPSAKASLSEKMAYWINVYNANTIKLILDHYPISSIKNIDSGKPWDNRFVNAGSTYYSLNEIENKILRPMGNPRIHFAVNCAAKSCPKLMNKAYTADNLEVSLAANTKAFLSKSEFVVNKDKLIISRIFEWYNDDFGDIKSWVGKQMGIEVSPNAKVIYKDYDWDLNN